MLLVLLFAAGAALAAGGRLRAVDEQSRSARSPRCCCRRWRWRCRRARCWRWRCATALVERAAPTMSGRAARGMTQQRGVAAARRCAMRRWRCSRPLGRRCWHAGRRHAGRRKRVLPAGARPADARRASRRATCWSSVALGRADADLLLVLERCSCCGSATAGSIRGFAARRAA